MTIPGLCFKAASEIWTWFEIASLADGNDRRWTRRIPTVQGLHNCALMRHIFVWKAFAVCYCDLFDCSGMDVATVRNSLILKGSKPASCCTGEQQAMFYGCVGLHQSMRELIRTHRRLPCKTMQAGQGMPR